jgi:flagellar motility protein MotE (MotC chaperone)
MGGYAKATHCKECGVEFSEANPKSEPSRFCHPCHKAYNRKRSGWRSKAEIQNFKSIHNDEYYKRIREENAELQSREEWLNKIRERLDKAITTLDNDYKRTRV